MIVHPFLPLYDKNSKVLVLGSFPSVKSREMLFFYGHPQNRFWQVTSAVFSAPVPVTVPEKKQFLLDNHLALWDVIASCEISGSADSTIKNAVPNDISEILDNSDIQKIFTNGKTATKYYDKYIKPQIGRESVCLPSTSPANAAWTLEKLVGAWNVIKI